MAQKKKKGSKPVKKDPDKLLEQQKHEKVVSIVMISVFVAIIVAAMVLIFVLGVPGNGSSSSGSYEPEDQTVSAVSYQESAEPSQVSDLSLVDLESDKTYIADITVKDYGKITVELDQKSAPLTVQNFVTLAQSGFYDGLTFHRIMEGFMIQGGDPKGDGTGGAEHTIKGEFAQNGVNNPISHKRGVISMARNSMSMDSASSQFFIVQTDDHAATLDENYAAFGHVTSGMEFVDKIAADAQPIDNNGTIEKEKQPVIESIKITVK